MQTLSRTDRPIHIINVPLDLGAGRRGTDAGPSAFRIAGLADAIRSLGYRIANESDIAVAAVQSAASNQGPLRYQKEILEVCTKLALQTKSAMDAGEWPLVIGGDHSIAMGSVAGVAAHLQSSLTSAANQGLGLIWFDAHGDMNLPESSPTGNVHGMPLAHLLGYGDPALSNILGMGPAVKPQNVVLIGLRDIDDKERSIINESGVTAFTMRDIDQLGMNQVVKQALEIANCDTAGYHVSFDLDGCDPEVIPGTGTTVPGGVSLREAHLLLEECAAYGRMISMDVVELNPFLDQRNVSAERAITLIQSALGRSIL